MRGIDRFLAAILLAGALGSTAMFARHLGSVPELQAVHLAAPPQHVTASGTVRAPVLVPLEGTPVRARAAAQPVLDTVRPAAVPQPGPEESAPRPRPQAPPAPPGPATSTSPPPPAPAAPAAPPLQPVQQPVEQPAPPEAPRVLAAVPPAVSHAAKSNGHGRLTAPGQLKKPAVAAAESVVHAAPLDVPAPVATLAPATPADVPEGDDDEGPDNGTDNAGWHGNGHGRGHGKHE